MADVQITPGLRARRTLWTPAGSRAARDWVTPNIVIAAITMLAFALRLYYLSRPGFLFGVTEYDDGSYLGSAIRLVHGQLPYRDFVFVQPPGITLLLVPVALMAKVTGTAGAMALGRILTVLAATAGVAAAGLLIRHRGRLAVLLTCGICAVHPDGIAAAHTVLVEPWLVLFCLLGTMASFDGDRLAGGRRVVWAGLAFGFAGVIESWAIIPVLVLTALRARRPRRATAFAAATAAGFLIPTLPFAALAPASFYQSVVVAQVGRRLNATRIYSLYRIRLMSGLSEVLHPASGLVYGITAAVIGLVLAGLAAAWLAAGQPPAALDGFAAVTGALVAAIFLWPPQFHYHFVAFLVPFGALAVAMSAARLAGALGTVTAGRSGAGQALRRGTCVLAVIGISLAAGGQADYERTQQASVSPAEFGAVRSVIPPGSCVLADEVSDLVEADRFVSDVPGCPAIDDGTGVNYALSHGLSTATGASRVPAVVAVWRSAFARAQFVWLSYHAAKRVPWTPSLVRYFRAHFARVRGLGTGISLYRRRPARHGPVTHEVFRRGRRASRARNESPTVG